MLRPAFFLGVLATLSAAGAPDLSKGQPRAVLDARVGVNTRLGDDPAALPDTQRGQAEPHIYRSAISSDTLLATFQEGRYSDAGSIDCGYAVSRNGGLNWTRALVPQLTVASGGPYNRATDPVAAIGPQGEMYLESLVSVSGAFDAAAIVVSRSTDNGATWTAPGVVFQSNTLAVMPDKPWLAVNDYAGAATAGRLVATWTIFTPTNEYLVASISNDRGATWSAPINITPTTSFNQGSLPLFLPDGSLVVVYTNFLPSDVSQLLCKRSTDGGLTYPATATSAVAAFTAWDDPVMRDGDDLGAACVARASGDLFAACQAVVDGSPRILVTKSSDKGATWSTPVIASDNPAGVSVMNPAIAASPDGKTVTVVFMDKRNASDGANFVDQYAAMSFDGGATWQPNVRLTELTNDVRYAPPTDRGYMLGDYQAIAPPTDTDPAAIAIWCDTRTGDSDPFVTRIALTPSADFNAWATVRRVAAGFLDDSDRDHYLNYVEYLDGTDPSVAESGEALFLRLTSPTTLDIFWTQRAGLPSLPPRLGVTISSDLAKTFSSTIDLTTDQGAASLSPDQLPRVVLPPGLVWTGARATIPLGAARAVGRTVNVTGTIIGFDGDIATINTDSRLINLSTRGQIKTGASQLIAGFVTRGGPRTLLVRGIGPSLASFGVSNFAADPTLTLTSTATGAVVAQNDNWQSGGLAVVNFIGGVDTQVGAFPLSSPQDAVIVPASLAAGGYTAQVSNLAPTGGSTGLVEVYDASTDANGQLVNLATRGQVDADSPLIAGFVVGGTQPRRLLLRAVGPSLAQFNVAGAIADPVLTLYRGNTVLATNDDWQISRSSGAIAATAQRVGAFALTPGSLDAALLMTLAPGAYTAVITGANGATGLALVEVYDAD